MRYHKQISDRLEVLRIVGVHEVGVKNIMVSLYDRKIYRFLQMIF